MMKLQAKWIAASLLLSSSVLTLPAHAIGTTGTSADFGAAATAGSADHTIELKAGTKWVNVTCGETVRFTEGDKSFTWHVLTFHGGPFNLSSIAPKDFDAKGVRVYVAADPAISGA
jgi:hypothetical protein